MLLKLTKDLNEGFFKENSLHSRDQFENLVKYINLYNELTNLPSQTDKLQSVLPQFLREERVSINSLTQKIATTGLSQVEISQIKECAAIEIALHQRKPQSCKRDPAISEPTSPKAESKRVVKSLAKLNEKVKKVAESLKSPEVSGGYPCEYSCHSNSTHSSPLINHKLPFKTETKPVVEADFGQSILSKRCSLMDLQESQFQRKLCFDSAVELPTEMLIEPETDNFESLNEDSISGGSFLRTTKPKMFAARCDFDDWEPQMRSFDDFKTSFGAQDEVDDELSMILN